MSLHEELIHKSVVLTIDRPKSYNATDINIINTFHSVLDKHIENEQVDRIIIKSAHPDVFCAGGDIKNIFAYIRSGKLKDAQIFFEREYDLIKKLSIYPKPVVSIVNGLCLGGGMGISMHNQYNIITENAVLAMPETSIGFFPDAGVSYKFAKLPLELRNFYGLTGYPISHDIAVINDFAHAFIESKDIDTFFEKIVVCKKNTEQEVIKQMQKKITSHDTKILFNDNILKIFQSNLAGIFAGLENDNSSKSQEILNDLKKKSPLSLCVTYEMLERAIGSSLNKALQTDKILANNFAKHQDFIEGIRAQVVDKDKNPKWKHKLVEDVKQGEILELFQGK